MTGALPVVLVPGLACSSRIYDPQIPALWRRGPVFLANHARGGDMAAIARRILMEAPLRFALAGHSMGGAIVFEMFRQAPERIARLALLNTYAHPETPAFAEFWRGLIAKVKQGGYRAMMDAMFAGAVHPSRANDARLKAIVTDMADDTGPDAFVWQVEAIMTRADSRPTLAGDQMPDAGHDQRYRQQCSEPDVGRDRERYRRREAHHGGGLRASVADRAAGSRDRCTARLAGDVTALVVRARKTT